jgi:type IV pilus assembly protein PilW
MTLITDIVQAAGYFPDPTANTSTGSLPEITVSEVTVAAGQSLYGTHVDTDPGDTLTARFTTASGDTIINCIGGTNTSGAVARYVNTFSVTGGRLACALNGAAASPLVEGIKRMDVRYGVKRDTTDDNNNVDTYLRADQMAAADWGNVSSVKVRLTFDNPLAEQAGQPATIQFTRTIAIMARTGVKL